MDGWMQGKKVKRMEKERKMKRRVGSWPFIGRKKVLTNLSFIPLGTVTQNFRNVFSSDQLEKQVLCVLKKHDF